MPSFLDKDGFQHFVDTRIGHADYTGLGATITEALMNSGGSRVGITLKWDDKKAISDVVYTVKQGDYVVTAPVAQGVTYVEVSGFRDITTIAVNVSFKLDGTPTMVSDTIVPTGYFKYDVSFDLGGDIWDGWLATSNIDADYDSLEDLIKDNQAMSVLFANHASVDYFVDWCAQDETLWPQFRDNLTVQKTIAKYDYSWEKIDEIPGARDYFLNSDNWEIFLKDHVPIMTSLTTPEGEVIYNTSYGVTTGYEAWRSFDGNNTIGYLASSGGTKTNVYIGYKFVNPIKVNRMFATTGNIYISSGVDTPCIIQGSDDGSTWANLHSFTWVVSDQVQNIKFENDNYYLYYRLLIPTQTLGTNANAGRVYELQFYGRSMSGVPKMISSTAPEGEAFGKTELTVETFYPYKAFDKIPTTYFATNAWAAGGNGILGYSFENPVNVTSFLLQNSQNNNYGIKEFRIEATNDSEGEWDVIGNTSYTMNNGSNSTICVSVNNAKYYRHYRIYPLSIYNTSKYCYVGELNFFYKDLRDPQLIYYKGLNASTLLEKARWTGTPYTDMAELLKDEKAIRQIMTVHDSVDYIVEALSNNAEQAKEFLNNDLVAKWVNLRDYALDSLYAVDTIKSVMDEVDKYGYGEWAFIPQVPAMTSNTAPYGRVFGSSYYSSQTGAYDYWKAFDRNNTTSSLYWCSTQADAVNSYVGYEFPSPIIVSSVNLINSLSSTAIVKTFVIEASNDGTNYTQISDVRDNPNIVSNSIFVPISDTNAYKYYRIKNLSVYASYASWGEIQFYKWQPKGNIPVMTSNTDPYGSIIGGPNYHTNYPYYKVFDGNEAQASSWLTSSVGQITNAYIGYKFTNPIKAKRLRYYCGYGSTGITASKIQASNNGSTWIDLLDTGALPEGERIYDLDNDNYYLMYRLLIVSQNSGSNANGGRITTLQFYGRSLNVSVPKMTSNTAPYGEVISSGLTTGDKATYKAFGPVYDSDVGNWLNRANNWGGYRFIKPMTIKFGYFNGGFPSSIQVKIQGSNDGSSWTDLAQFDAKETVVAPLLENEVAYTHYRVIQLAQYPGWTNFGGKIQFFGVDYSEREFEIGSTMKYIYDHGVSIDGMQKVITDGILTEDENQIVFKTNSTSSNLQIGKEINFDEKDYKIIGAKVGNTIQSSRIIVTDTTAWTVDNPIAVLGLNPPLNSPYNCLPISNISGSHLTLFGVGGNINRYGSVTEFWLE